MNQTIAAWMWWRQQDGREHPEQEVAVDKFRWQQCRSRGLIQPKIRAISGDIEVERCAFCGVERELDKAT